MINRIKQLIDYKSMSKSEFANTIGMSQTTFNNQMIGKRSLSLDTIVNILNTFSEISSEWLIRGKGDMILSSAPINVYELLLDERDKKIRELELELSKYKQTTNVG